MELLLLLFLFQLKHYACDYLFVTEFMLNKGVKDSWILDMLCGKPKSSNDWILPLSSHCFIHMLPTIAISYCVLKDTEVSFYLGLFDFVSHFIIDRLKASPNYGGKYSASDKKYWMCFGLDQLAHNTIYILILSVLFYYG
jgi:Protein of unknown function (DUF3307).